MVKTYDKELGHWVAHPPKRAEDFLSLAPELPDLVDFDFVPLFPSVTKDGTARAGKDSSNMTPADWKVMAEAVYQRRNQGFAGFVIAHGTDTMHFSASALAFALGPRLSFPVVFTGAQTTPDIPHGDARVNLLRAIKVATFRNKRTNSGFCEVVLAFNTEVFRGCRAQKRSERQFDAFESPSFDRLADITEEISPHDMAKFRPRESGPLQLRADFAENIFQMTLVPGMEPDFVEAIIERQNLKGIILASFGAGNVPSEDGSNFSFLGVIEKAAKRGIPVVITSQFPAYEFLDSDYEPFVLARRAGAIPTGNMTAACAVAKFRWVLAQADKLISENKLSAERRIDKVREMMETIYVGEMDKKRKA